MPKSPKYKSMQDRAATRGVHGDRCYLCRKGPLVQRAMNLVLVQEFSEVPLPMCKECADSWGDSVEYVQKVARLRVRQYKHTVALLQAMDFRAEVPR